MAGSCDDGLSHPYDISSLIYLREADRKKYLSINPVLRVLVDGTCDEKCVFSLLNGTPHVLGIIWDHIVQYWKGCIKCGTEKEMGVSEFSGKISFPKPRNIQINMMPFYMSRTFEESMLPEYLRPYWDCVINYPLRFRYQHCKIITEKEVGKVGFLTIHESKVKKGNTQRRAGLHTDCPGKLMVVPNENDEYICLGRVMKDEEEELCNVINNRYGSGYYEQKMTNYTHPWGMTFTEIGHDFVGGIYMASSVSDTCAVWNCQVKSDRNGDEIIGDLGDTEHLREFLPCRRLEMKANYMYWITDRTPHESLPFQENSYRQYFRLVTSEVSVWFEEHSTKNPYGVEPDPKITKILRGSKFEDNLALLVDLEEGDVRSKDTSTT